MTLYFSDFKKNKKKIIAMNIIHKIIINETKPGALEIKSHQNMQDFTKTIDAHEGPILLAEFCALNVFFEYQFILKKTNIVVTFGQDWKIIIWSLAKYNEIEKIIEYNLASSFKNENPNNLIIKWSPYFANHLICYTKNFLVALNYPNPEPLISFEFSQLDEIFFMKSSLHRISYILDLKYKKDYMIVNEKLNKLFLVEGIKENNIPKITEILCTIQSPIMYF